MEMNGEILPILEAIENDFIFDEMNFRFGQGIGNVFSDFICFVDPECFEGDAELLSMLYSNMDVIL